MARVGLLTELAGIGARLSRAREGNEYGARCQIPRLPLNSKAIAIENDLRGKDIADDEHPDHQRRIKRLHMSSRQDKVGEI